MFSCYSFTKRVGCVSMLLFHQMCRLCFHVTLSPNVLIVFPCYSFTKCVDCVFMLLFHQLCRLYFHACMQAASMNAWVHAPCMHIDNMYTCTHVVFVAVLCCVLCILSGVIRYYICMCILNVLPDENGIEECRYHCSLGKSSLYKMYLCITSFSLAMANLLKHLKIGVQ